MSFESRQADKRDIHIRKAEEYRLDLQFSGGPYTRRLRRRERFQKHAQILWNMGWARVHNSLAGRYSI